MARRPRIILPGYTQHVVQRGNNRQACFFAAADYRQYHEDLITVAARQGCAIHAYVLMPNHVHLLLTPPAGDTLARLMQDLGRRYVRYINDKYARTGTLWAGRYKASLVDAARYLLTCMAFIESNPVRTGRVGELSAYPYSSFARNALGQRDCAITPHRRYQGLGATEADRQRAYRQIVESSLKESQVRQIKEALNRQLVLGSEQFKREIHRLAHQCTHPGQAGRLRGRHEVGGWSW